MKQKSERLVNNKDLYQFQVGNMNVEFKYSENDKKINECMTNILKQKNKMGWYIILGTLYYKRMEGRNDNGWTKIKIFFRKFKYKRNKDMVSCSIYKTFTRR